ncbi:type IV toxin-antitoxin system AbiEi family antitoxin domain-containing protein [Candidatus Thiodiazotropha endoloripes]|uniref:type IV toxin-antitoxin system AbiEi family antitoxin domain-containing protein n=1 Tax=Candidatus Thiodiazotropha endoloripes TaxID=1818881 RepID=UPI001F341696|nr:type IV toxin-antitoxin system AbiEi family antitoxin domain-containing protein [Candidatus Thiodiazotropha endoloripes]
MNQNLSLVQYLLYKYTMGIRKDEKLNRLQQLIPEGVAVPSSWLSANGYTPQLVRKYVLSGWLNSLGSRVYARPGEPVTWEGVVLGLQKLGQLRLHIGGVTALNRQGLAHYLSLSGDANVHVWGKDRPPSWVEQVSLNVALSFHHRCLFSQEPAQAWVMLPTKVRDWTIRVSAPERAILEVLSEVDETPTSFSFAAELFEGLTTARPAVVNTLLESCVHNKAKRLFLFLANHYAYPWTKRIDLEAIDLGRGKRMVTRGGRLDKHYQITVPDAFHAKPE